MYNHIYKCGELGVRHDVRENTTFELRVRLKLPQKQRLLYQLFVHWRSLFPPDSDAGAGLEAVIRPITSN